ncbi:DUF4377 domain-containing protein [Alcanivorax sp.]|uniref:DUF4377 domain-containing protein n=1 Tax=Alcanivorax sp. TaxID=1872427 RepID=UPI0025BA42E8|nr:DUF4377 domain-containing protein [Alcanivorax sp.]
MKRGWRIGLAIVPALLLVGCESEPEGQLLEVAPYRTACIGVGPMECLQVRRDGEESYSLFYSKIEGFEFESGYQYTLRVKVTPVKDAPTDASSERYTLLEVVEKADVNQQEAP